MPAFLSLSLFTIFFIHYRKSLFFLKVKTMSSRCGCDSTGVTPLAEGRRPREQDVSPARGRLWLQRSTMSCKICFASLRPSTCDARPSVTGSLSPGPVFRHLVRTDSCYLSSRSSLPRGLRTLFMEPDSSPSLEQSSSRKYARWSLLPPPGGDHYAEITVRKYDEFNSWTRSLALVWWCLQLSVFSPPSFCRWRCHLVMTCTIYMCHVTLSLFRMFPFYVRFYIRHWYCSFVKVIQVLWFLTHWKLIISRLLPTKENIECPVLSTFISSVINVIASLDKSCLKEN